MKTLTIRTQPTPGAEEMDITIVLDNLDFAFKVPLEPWVLVLPGTQFNVDKLDEEALVDAGLLAFDTPVGTTAYVNPARIIGYISPRLGVYLIVFNGPRIPICATEAEIKQKFGISGLVL